MLSTEVEPASCERRCQACHKDFMVVGRRRENASVTPAVETVACPYCRDIRRAMLAPDVEGPVSAVFRLEEWQGTSDERPDLTDRELDEIEARAVDLAERNGDALVGQLCEDVDRVAGELRRLRAEVVRLRVENRQVLQRLRNQSS